MYTRILAQPLLDPNRDPAAAALCNAQECLELEGFSAAMFDQIRNFTLSLLTDSAR